MREALHGAAIAGRLLAVLFGLALVVLTGGPALLGMESLVVVGGSMAPTIPRGAMVFVRYVPPSALRVGDVVTFHAAGQGNALVTHRVVSLELGEQGLELRTRGDNNDSEDVWKVRGDETAGRVVASLPVAGYVVAWTGSIQARLALMALIAAVLGRQLFSRRPRLVAV